MFTRPEESVSGGGVQGTFQFVIVVWYARVLKRKQIFVRNLHIKMDAASFSYLK